MALNFPSVFGKTDDDLKPRWQQSGSTLINYYETGVSNEELRTVTAGKTFYLATIFCQATDATITLRDGGAAGTIIVKIYHELADSTKVVEFNTPLSFTTDVYAETSDDNWTVTLIGWEE